MRKTILLLLLLTLTAVAQQPALQGPPKAQTPSTPAAPVTDEPYTLRVNPTLVIETVTVNDTKGNPITDLTAKDFAVTEDNVPQAISIFEYQKLDNTPLAPLAVAAPTVAAPAAAEPPKPVVPSVTGSEIKPEAAGDVRYKDRRLLVLYFDMTAMPDVDQLRALSAADKFIKTQITGPDMMAIMNYSGGAVKVLQDFTDNRDKLEKAIDTLIIGEGTGFDEAISDASAADTGTAFGQDDSEFNIFNTDRQLAALQTAVNMLRPLNEKKSLVYFASGLNLNGVDNQAQLHATENEAIRANVAIYAVDARGLVATPPMGTAAQGSAGGAAMYNGQAAMAGMSRFQRSQDTLYALAEDTGGKAMLDTNDLSAGIVKAQQAVTSYYIIGYYTTNPTPDGKFRRIKITLKEIPSKLAYREGYFAGKEFGKFTLADKERQLEEALMLGDPITELTIGMELNYFQLNKAEYFVPLTVKIPGSELALAKKGGAQHTLIDFIGEIKDNYGTTIQNVRDKVDIKISDDTALELAKRPIEYDTGFTILPGSYVIKFLARDSETGRIGTYQQNFIIPNLNKEEMPECGQALQRMIDAKTSEDVILASFVTKYGKAAQPPTSKSGDDLKAWLMSFACPARVPISSVVISSQRVEMKDALYNAQKKDTAAQDANPLVENGQKLIPSVTRVFSKSKDMYIYLQAYEPNATTTEPLIAFVTFYRGQTKAFQTAPLAFNDGLNPKSKAVPLRFDLSLSQLPPGQYLCQVTILKPGEQKAAYWQSAVMLVP